MSFRPDEPREHECRLCGKRSQVISETIGTCVDCLREGSEDALACAMETHASSRHRWGLPPLPPKDLGGAQCNLCSNMCLIGEGKKGFCGIRANVNGHLKSMSDPGRGVLYAYRDPHVTNCCSAWFCPAGTGAGYPRFAHTTVAERGFANYAVFFYGCNFDCLFCQNSSHKNVSPGNRVSLEDFVSPISGDKGYSCVCYFGGSPEPQLPFAIGASKAVLEENPGRIIRICFEWNGCGNPELVRKAARLSLESGGNIKFDLKCFNENVSRALSGVPNRRAYENFEMISRELCGERSDLPLLTATTLLVPGYVDASEVERIASFIADLNPEIPYSLLVFHPDYLMSDLPITPRRQVEECYQKAKKHLRRVHVGNIGLLNL